MTYDYILEKKKVSKYYVGRQLFSIIVAWGCDLPLHK